MRIHAGQCEDRAGRDVDAHQHPLDLDAGQPGGLGVVADRVDVPAPGGVLEHEREDGVHDQHHHDAGRDPDVGDGEGLTEPGQPRPELGVADGAAGRVEEGERNEDVQRPESDDERWQPDLGHEQAVHGTGACPHQDPEQERERTGDAGVEGGLGHHHRREHHDGATGQVDAGGEDDQGLTDRERPDDGHLLGDEREVVGRRELAVEQPEDDDADHKDDGRAQPRVSVQCRLHPLCRGAGLEELLGRVVVGVIGCRGRSAHGCLLCSRTTMRAREA